MKYLKKTNFKIFLKAEKMNVLAFTDPPKCTNVCFTRIFIFVIFIKQNQNQLLLLHSRSNKSWVTKQSSNSHQCVLVHE
jgi:hypothetical protein